jgi:hypothetical protein
MQRRPEIESSGNRSDAASRLYVVGNDRSCCLQASPCSLVRPRADTSRIGSSCFLRCHISVRSARWEAAWSEAVISPLRPLGTERDTERARCRRSAGQVDVLLQNVEHLVLLNKRECLHVGSTDGTINTKAKLPRSKHWLARLIGLYLLLFIQPFVAVGHPSLSIVILLHTLVAGDDDPGR